MAHCFILDFDGGTAAQYDAIIEDMELGGRLPAKALYHGAGSPDGRSWRVVDVWESPEDFERFAAEKIGPLRPGTASASRGSRRSRSTRSAAATRSR